MSMLLVALLKNINKCLYMEELTCSNLYGKVSKIICSAWYKVHHGYVDA